MATSFQWITPPSVMANNVKEYGKRLTAGAMAIADKRSAEAQGEMRQQARWTDRTGNARSGLFSMAEMVNSGEAIVIYFSHGHTVEYGIFLETAIIVPTMSRYVQKIREDLQRLVS